MAVYFAQNVVTSHIKIGYTAGDPEKRISNLQTSIPENLIIRMVVPEGSLTDESDFHRKFKRSHLQREWFKYRPEIYFYLHGKLHINDRYLLFCHRFDLWPLCRNSRHELNTDIELMWRRGNEEAFDEAMSAYGVLLKPEGISDNFNTPTSQEEWTYLCSGKDRAYARQGR